MVHAKHTTPQQHWNTIPNRMDQFNEQFKKFHSKLNTTEGALHFKIGKRTKNRRL
jgi:hypothetical protein